MGRSPVAVRAGVRAPLGAVRTARSTTASRPAAPPRGRVDRLAAAFHPTVALVPAAVSADRCRTAAAVAIRASSARSSLSDRQRAWRGGSVWLHEPLITNRLRLRAFAERDRHEVVRLRSDGQVRRFLGGSTSPAGVEPPRRAADGNDLGVVAVANQETDRVMGSVDLSRERGEREVSWVLLPEHWGSRFAQEAVTAVIEWAFEQGADRRIIAVTPVREHRVVQARAQTEYDTGGDLRGVRGRAGPLRPGT
jgi:hypothetical protein